MISLALCTYLRKHLWTVRREVMLATFYNTTLVYRFYDNDSLYNDH